MTEEKYVEDEIDLRDYIKVILKRKGVIFTVFLIPFIRLRTSSISNRQDFPILKPGISPVEANL